MLHGTDVLLQTFVSQIIKDFLTYFFFITREFREGAASFVIILMVITLHWILEAGTFGQERFFYPIT